MPLILIDLNSAKNTKRDVSKYLFVEEEFK
jgi:hypothetical protein